MRIFKDYHQKQTFLLLPSVEEFVPAEHSAGIISDVIDTIDLHSIVSEYNGGVAYRLSSGNDVKNIDLCLQPGDL